MQPRALRTYSDFIDATTNRHIVLVLIRWLLGTGRFQEFRLAMELNGSTEAEGSREGDRERGRE